MKTTDFKPGMLVSYHNQVGVVSSTNDTYVFIRFFDSGYLQGSQAVALGSVRIIVDKNTDKPVFIQNDTQSDVALSISNFEDTLALQETYGDSGDYYEKLERGEAKAFDESLENCPNCSKRRYDGVHCYSCNYNRTIQEEIDRDVKNYYETGSQSHLIDEATKESLSDDFSKTIYDPTEEDIDMF
jgi:hypothetical protein